MGTLSFFAIAIESFFFTRQADTFGRKPVILVATMVTPIGVALLLLLGTNLTLYWIYAILIMIALAYNPRASTSYLYATEVLPKRRRMLFGGTLFTIDGLFTISAAYYFFVVGDQNLMMILLSGTCILAMIVLFFFLPESPSFLLITGKGIEYQKSIDKLIGEQESSAEMERWLPVEENSSSDQALQEHIEANSGFRNLWKKPVLRNNLIGCCILASSNAFCMYMIAYYTKYFKGNIFTNYAMLGIADSLSLFYVTILSHFFDVKGVIRFGLVSIMIIACLFISLENQWDWVTPVGILLLRLSFTGLENYRYHLT
mmetsp:Transcript_67896/g.94014  ORF Transcript_67896/g.94014 Transcript_67896/m.94014 type:complete len:315 (+) Transcript_67896:458-1402(+)